MTDLLDFVLDAYGGLKNTLKAPRLVLIRAMRVPTRSEVAGAERDLGHAQASARPKEFISHGGPV